MKKELSLTELSTAELYQKKQSLQGVIIGLALVAIAACVILLYLVFTTKSAKVLVALPLASFLGFLPAMFSLKQINEEIKNRAVK